MMNKQLLSPGKIKAWGVIVFDNKYKIDMVSKKFAQPLAEALQSMGE